MRKLKPTRPPRTHARGWHEGSVTQVRPGVYRAYRARVHRPDGTSSRPTKTFQGVDSEARAASWAKGDPEPAVVYLGAWMERWLALRKPTLDPSTFALYEEAVSACGDLLRRPIAELTTEDWQLQANTLLERWSRYHVAVWKGNVSTALRAAIPRYLAQNPIAGVKLPAAQEQPPPVWTQAEVDRLLAAAAGGAHEAWLLFSLGTGVRLGESRALLWVDVDLVAKTATIRASLDNTTSERGPTKSRKVRVVDLPDEVVPLLVERRARQRPVETLVFGHPGPYHASTYRKWLSRVCAQASVRELPPHSLRHTCASLALDAGVPVQDVAHQLGHTVEVCQRIYSHYIGGGLRRTANALGKALSNRFSGPRRKDGAQLGAR